jgi:hypothetical protein
MKSLISTIIISLVLLSCSYDNKPEKEKLTQQIKAAEDIIPEFSDENIEMILSSIPSPLELSMHIKGTGIPYDRSLLNDAEAYTRYNTSDRKAINLGIYGTDLGYTDIYDHVQDGLNYLSAVKKLADDLNIGQFLDFEAIKRLTHASNNMDSLLMITNQNFEDINKHFRQQKQASLSTLLLTGGWLEALHITTQVTLKQMDNKLLRDRVGEQKIVLDNIVILLSTYGENDNYIKELLKDMKILEEAYTAVNISYTYEASTAKVVNGILEIQSNNKSEVEIDDETIQNIAVIVHQIRRRVVS